MNPRRVHTLFLKYFPEPGNVDHVRCEWIHLFRDGAVDRDLLRKMLSTIGADELIVHVHRKLGDFLSAEEALVFISEHVGKGNIRVADRAFTNFVVVMRNGVAATWPRCVTRSEIDALPEKINET